MVKDKINYRPLGPRTALTRQPVSGRANDGGLRIGEMERDVLLSHGISEFLRESMMDRGDKYKIAVCNVSGMISIYNPAKNLFVSPMADGPIKFTGSLDGKSMNIENVTRFGRDFSVVSVPYSLKLLIQELQTMNIQMRIITEDNIEKLENMSFSKNIDNLLFSNDVTPQTIVSEIKRTLAKVKNTDEPVPGSCEQTKDQPIEYPDVSPAYQPSNVTTPINDPNSPVYNPLSPEETTNFSPHSPDEPPPPEFSPHSPEEPPPQQQTFSPHSPEEPPPFKGGEKVHYRGDKRPEREWSVEKVGDNFITISTQDGYGMSPEDKIKVVEPFELYRQGDYAYNLMEPGANGHFMPPEKQMFSNQVPAGINFAPVIKINNGGTEYSVDQEGRAQPKISFDNADVGIPPIEPAKNIVFKKELNEPSEPLRKEEPVKTGGDGGGGLFTGIKDFIIKKLG